MSMTCEQYRNLISTTAVYPPEQALEYLGLGLAGEAGEVAGKLSKVIRDHGGEISLDMRIELAKELGDTLWFADRLAELLGFSLEDIMALNVAKLMDRQKRKMLHGNGDNR